MVVRNDAVSVADVAGMSPQAIVISPGPCTPNESGISMELIRELGLRIPILGVCLGHQAMAAALGGRVIRAPEPVHGRTSFIRHDGCGLFAGLPNPMRATRYHSLMWKSRRSRRHNGLPPGPKRACRCIGTRQLAGLRRAVSSGVDPDRRGTSVARKFSARGPNTLPGVAGGDAPGTRHGSPEVDDVW